MSTAALSLRAYLSGCRTLIFAISAAVFGMYVTTVIVPYGFADDYTILWMVKTKEPTPQFGKNVLDASAITGRALGGLLDDLFFGTAETIDNLRFLRLTAIVAIVALALLLHWALVRSGIRPTVAALIAVFVCSMPAFQVYASWADLFSSPFAALLAGGASFFAVAAVEAPRRLVLDRLVGATILLVAALQIYQPGAMFFWVFLVVALVGARDDSRRAFDVVRAHFGIGIVSLGISYVIIKLSVHFIGSSTIGAGRNSITHDVWGKIRWFWHEPLFRSASLFELTPSRWFAITVALVIVVGLSLALRRAARPVLYAVVALVLVPLCYLPNLVVTEFWASVRTQVSLSSLLALYACLGALGIWVTVREWLQLGEGGRAALVAERCGMGAAVALVALSAFFAAENVTTYFAVPQVTELRLLRTHVAAFPNGVSRFAFVESDWGQGMTSRIVYDEFGFPSSARPWVPGPEVNLILQEEGRLVLGHEPALDLYEPNTTVLPSGEPHVDLHQQLMDLR